MQTLQILTVPLWKSESLQHGGSARFYLHTCILINLNLAAPRHSLNIINLLNTMNP